MSLQEAIERNRARQAAKNVGQPQASLRVFKVRVAVIPTALDVALGIAQPISVGQVVPTKIVTVYGTSRKDAMIRAGIV